MKRIAILLLTLIALAQITKSNAELDKVLADAEDEDEDFDLDMIDINSPQEVQDTLKKFFPSPESTINMDTMLSILYKFLLNHSKTNIDIIEQKHQAGKKIKHDEEDLLSSAHTVQMMVIRSMDKNHKGDFSKKMAKKLMNKEKYHDFIHSYAKEILSKIDTKSIEEAHLDYDPVMDL
jgi:hypothetical protein